MGHFFHGLLCSQHAMNSSAHPLILIAALSVVAALVVVVLAVRARKAMARTLLGLLAAVLLVPGAFVFHAYYPEVFDRRFATYKNFYEALEIGMTREQVLATMDRLYPEGGARLTPIVLEDTADSLGFFMDSEGARAGLRGHFSDP